MAALRIISASTCGDRVCEFLEQEGGVLFSPHLRSLGNSATEAMIIIDADGKLFGGFNIERTSLRGISALAHPQLHPHCGLILAPPAGKPASVNAWNKRLMETMADWLLAQSEPIVALALPVEITDVQALIWKGFRCTVRYTYRIHLHNDHDPSEAYTSGLRNDLRKAKELGVEVVETASLEELGECLHATIETKGFAMPPSALTKLFNAAKSGRALIRAARVNGKVIGFVITVHDDLNAYYLVGGLVREQNVRGALALLLDDAIHSYWERGYKVFDFEGSMIPGVAHFFRSFGGNLEPYYIAARAKWPFNWLLRLRGRSEF